MGILNINRPIDATSVVGTFETCRPHPAMSGDAAEFEKNLGEQKRERKTNRRVPSVYHGLIGTKRERLISKGFLHCGMVHGFNENRTLIPLKSLAIPAGLRLCDINQVVVQHFLQTFQRLGTLGCFCFLVKLQTPNSRLLDRHPSAHLGMPPGDSEMAAGAFGLFPSPRQRG